MITATMANPTHLKSYQFTVQPKEGSLTRAISTTYSSNALQTRGFLNLDSQVVTLPV